MQKTINFQIQELYGIKYNIHLYTAQRKNIGFLQILKKRKKQRKERRCVVYIVYIY